MNAIIIGPDNGLESAFEAHGITSKRIELGSADALRGAGIDEAGLVVITDVTEATAVPIAKDENPDVRVVIYSTGSMPEFVKGQVDLAVAPDVLSPTIFVEELANGQG